MTLSAGLTALLAPVARADGVKLAVPPVVSPLEMSGMGGLIAQQVVKAARDLPGAQVMTPDDVAGKLGPDDAKRLSECGLKAACAAAYLEPLGVQRAVLGTLDRDEVHYLVDLELIDVASALVVAEERRTVLIASRELESQVAALAPDLVAGKAHGPAHLTLTTRIAHLRVTIDDRPLAELPVTVELSPGKHEIKTEKRDYLTDDRFVELAEGEAKTVDIELTLLPNHYDADQPIEAAAPATANEKQEAAPASEGPSSFPWTPPRSSWAALSVAVAALAVSVPFAVDDANLRVKAVDPNGIGVMDITRAQVLRGQQDALVANAALVTAGAAAILAGVLYMVEGPPSSTDVAGATVRSGLASAEVRF